MSLKLVLIALATAILGLAAVACGSDDDDGDDGGGGGAAEVRDVPFEGGPEEGLPTSYPDPEPEDLTIGMLNPRRASESLTITFDAAKEQVAELGGESIELDANSNPDLQVSQFEQLVNQKVDGIIIFPLADPKLLQPVLERAGKAGIPVVGFELTPGEPVAVPGFATQVWQANDEMSYMQVKAAAEALGTGAKVGEVNLAIPVPVFEYNEERRRFWATKFGLEIVDSVDAADDTIDEAQEAAAGLVTGNPEIEGIFGFTDDAAIGAYLAARDASRADMKTFGQTAVSVGVAGIESGRLTASVYWDPPKLGREAVKGVYDAVQGTEIPPAVVAADPFPVTADNLDEVPSS